jgi:hypothetical protein
MTEWSDYNWYCVRILIKGTPYEVKLCYRKAIEGKYKEYYEDVDRVINREDKEANIYKSKHNYNKNIFSKNYLKKNYKYKQ